MLITGEENIIDEVTAKIKNKFKISKCNQVDFILGIKVEKIKNMYIISQKSLIDNILKRFNINNRKKKDTPCTGINDISENIEEFDKTKYKSAIGALTYL